MSNIVKANENNILIGMAGDVMIGRLVDEYLKVVKPEHIWGDLLPWLKAADFNLINLEAALTTSPHIVPKVFNFKSDPKHVGSLVSGSIHVVNLANNHVLDFSQEGLLETLTTLDKNGILHVGAGRHIKEAAQPAFIKRKEINVAIMGCTDNEPDWSATEKEPGIFYLEVGDIGAIRERLSEARKKADIVIVSLHWGPNMRERPTRTFINFAHELIDNGADIIHGHSAHIFQGVEVYKNRLILYDTGDFVDDYYVDPKLRNDRSFFFIVEAGSKGPERLHLIPVLIEDFRANMSEGDERYETVRRMQRLSEELHTKFKETSYGLMLNIQ